MKKLLVLVLFGVSCVVPMTKKVQVEVYIMREVSWMAGNVQVEIVDVYIDETKCHDDAFRLRRFHERNGTGSVYYRCYKSTLIYDDGV